MDPIIHIEKLMFQGIPALVFAPAGKVNCPVVFYVHGFGERKEDGATVGYRMAEAGLFCVLLDAYLHGERLAPPVSELDDPDRRTVFPPGTGFDTFFIMFDCVRQTAQDLDTLLNHFQNDSRANTQRVGVCGFSMGGFTAYHAAAHNPRISTAVPMGAYSALERRWQDLVVEASAYEQWEADMARLKDEVKQRADWFRMMDPYLKMKDAYEKPLLMMVGEHDTDAPKFYALPLYTALRARYQDHPEQIKLKIYDGVAHRLTREMIHDAVDWFQTFLIEKEK